MLEKEVGRDGRGDHQRQRQWIAPGPVEFRHVLKVHAVDAGDQGRRQEDRRRHRENLDDIGLFDIQHAQGGIEQEVDLARQKRRVVAQGLHIVIEGADARVDVHTRRQVREGPVICWLR